MDKQNGVECPLVMVDEFGGDNAAVWDFVGSFPLAAIARGRRACLWGWRTPTDSLNCYERYIFIGAFGMVAIVVGEGIESKTELLVQREYEDGFEIDGKFSHVEAMLSQEWYLERVSDQFK